MSILYRTRGWLTLAQLLPAWARELADDKINADHVERDLTHFLIEDMINGRLDDAGPLADDRRLGLRIITPDNRAGYLDGQQARELLMPAGTPAAFSLVSHRLVVMKEAVLDFARRHELPAPSWWADATIGQREQIDASPPNEGRESNTSDELAAEQEACAAEERSRALNGGPQRPRGKSRPAFERARGIIKELYPNGVPGQATEPNANLCRRVSAKLKEAKLPDVSNDTILRAGGRRNNANGANRALRYLPYLRNAESPLQPYSFRHRSHRRGHGRRDRPGSTVARRR